MKECCLPEGPKAKYNPRMKKFEFLRGSNLEAAEYSFKAINKHKSSTKSGFLLYVFLEILLCFSYMTAGRRMVYFLILEDEVILSRLLYFT